MDGANQLPNSPPSNPRAGPAKRHPNNTPNKVPLCHAKFAQLIYQLVRQF